MGGSGYGESAVKGAGLLGEPEVLRDDARHLDLTVEPMSWLPEVASSGEAPTLAGWVGWCCGKEVQMISGMVPGRLKEETALMYLED